MMYCQNCGQTNTPKSNFCRFCGTKFGASQFAHLNGAFSHAAANGGNFEYEPPRPYSWKTDEFQIPPTKVQSKPTKTKAFSQVEPLPDFAAQPPFGNRQMQTHQSAAMGYGFHCPRCRSQHLPRASRQISTTGWIVFAVLLVTIPFLFWIGLLIKEDVRHCAVCNFKFE